MKGLRSSKTTLCFILGCLLQATNSSPEKNVQAPPSEETQDNDLFNQTGILASTTESSPRDDKAIEMGANFLLGKRSTTSYGWGQETHRALTALALAGALLPEDQESTEDKLMIKELELRLAVALAKQHQEKLTTGQLALYVNALLGVCHNPRDFYGLNLVSKLRNRDEMELSYSYSLQSLALCNAGVEYDKARILKLIEYIKEDPSDHGGFTDSLSMTIMALACGLKYHAMPPVERYLNRAIHKLKQTQKTDGSFGNIYSSGLALQALILSDATEIGWNKSRTREYLLSQQRDDGSFVDFMGTFFALPPLLDRTLGSFANWSCDTFISTPDSNGKPTVTPSTESNRSEISISIQVKAQEIQEYRVDLKGYETNNLYSILVSNEEAISIEFKDTAYGRMIVGVDGLNQDEARKKYWQIYTLDKEGSEHLAETGVDGIIPKDGDRFVIQLQSFSK